MIGLIIRINGEPQNNRIVISTNSFIHKMIWTFLNQVYQINDQEISKFLQISLEHHTWKCQNISGTFEEMDIIA